MTKCHKLQRNLKGRRNLQSVAYQKGRLGTPRPATSRKTTKLKSTIFVVLSTTQHAIEQFNKHTVRTFSHFSRMQSSFVILRSSSPTNICTFHNQHSPIPRSENIYINLPSPKYQPPSKSFTIDITASVYAEGTETSGNIPWEKNGDSQRFLKFFKEAFFKQAIPPTASST